jgi:tetratricopeptide (TPR) repeat protein
VTNARAAVLGGTVGLVLVLGAAGARLALGPRPLFAGLVSAAATDAPAADANDDDDALPVPPVPPRIAQGEEYENCMAMLVSDPTGASSTAEAWIATGGGDGAVHCHAMAQVQLGNAEQGAEELEHLASTSTATAAARATVYGQAGQAWLMAGDSSRAFGATTLALALDPDDTDLLIDRAVAAGGINRFEDAVDDLNRALDNDPKRADALVLRGAAWRHLGHLDLAQDDIDRAVALDPDNAEAMLERGILRQRNGDLKGARADWERIASLDPDSPTADLAEQNLALLDAGPDQR